MRKDFPSAVLFSECQKYPRLGQAEARNLELNLSLVCWWHTFQYSSHYLLPIGCMVAGSCIGGGVVRPETRPCVAGGSLVIAECPAPFWKVSVLGLRKWRVHLEQWVLLPCSCCSPGAFLCCWLPLDHRGRCLHRENADGTGLSRQCWPWRPSRGSQGTPVVQRPDFENRLSVLLKCLDHKLGFLIP